jgi:hypothetical protein
MCFTLGASIAEIVSAFPTCGGLYSASALLCPKKHRARVRENFFLIHLVLSGSVSHIIPLDSIEYGGMYNNEYY